MTRTATVPEVPSLNSYLADETARVEEALREQVKGLPADMPESLRAAVVYALETRGKRLRPILTVAAYRLVRGSEDPVPAAVYRLAAAVEMLHTYSLVHDDLPCMDDDDLRRGRPTVHRVHGVRNATLTGAALIPLAFSALAGAAEQLGLAPGRTQRLVVELAQAAGAAGMVGGQWLDLEGESHAAGAARLERIHRAKTGALLAASLRIGGIAAGAADNVLAALTDYGQALGLAFQIADDILDVVGETAALGKTAGKDESAGKATYPSLYGLPGARALAEEKAAAAAAALRGAGVQAPELESLARYVVERRH